MSTTNTPEPQTEQNVTATGESSPTEKKTPSKRTRLSFIERAQKESEELVKNMGGSLELEGGRRTRSSTRGTPSRPVVVTPPPTKKARNSPASPKTTPRARGRGRKLDTSVTPEPPEQTPTKEPGLENEKIPAPVPAKEAEVVAKCNESEEIQKTKDAETNGPEISEDAQVNDVAAADKSVSQTEAQSSEIEQTAAVVEDNKSADQVDAAEEKVEDQSKEQTSNVKPESEVTITPPSKDTEECTKKEKTPDPEPVPVVAAAEVADSPMDVDEQPEQESSAEPAKSLAEKESLVSAAPTALSKPAIEEEVVPAEPENSKTAVVESLPVETSPNELSSEPVVKQPTPEPMEVDSSSKSSDVVECTDVVDKADSQAVENTNSTIQPAVQAVNESPLVGTVEPAVDSVTQNQHKAEQQNCTSTPAAVNNEKVVETTEKDIPSVPVTTDIKSIEVTEETKIDTVSENKAENNVVEPKLLSPALNATGDVAAAVTTS